MTVPRPESIIPPAGNPATGAAGIARAFKRALVSQCHPNMLFAVLLPFVIALLGAILLLWLFWTPLNEWLRFEASQWQAINQVDDWMVAAGLFSLKIYLVPVIAAAILLPISGILGLAIAAVFVMPLVLRHVGGREYAGLARQGRNATAVSVWNALWVSLAFGAGWLLTLPFWLIPPMAVILSVFWWAFAFTRMLRLDAIVEHASPAERAILLKRHNSGFWLIGLVCSLLNLLPPAWIILPVFSGLVYAHYGLDALQRLRQERTIDV
ncbi:EI24 domain-containing protein [Bordetella bronchiseptica]|uniref:EI24 domain-containing protein n=1 Tax=Bordetella bronchiseptica TaxID=518 RepID=UPI000290628E|nr:EI24 domain-containing protein [Bordetella bronchiseptica]KCV34550.1 etoposide-induced protein 2.4 [Bordetella bronchiseptica 00-P-2730]KAK52807.1 etoposide-induced protein 2.4 [Bordetella bronchiseptica OSU054]KAK72565.1 etoposide-induced protein 2.4 [Bordetella bronchiseptica MO211]KCV56438.1 etoposide-induced protein 2.4 [Bordetella bronchiseptica 7E71]KDB72606.1 etoposide-induced protein 2.4 [Bordetella bronchiseptica CA90 BB1334]